MKKKIIIINFKTQVIYNKKKKNKNEEKCMSTYLETDEQKREITREKILKNIKNIKLILDILSGEITNHSYDKISDSISSLNLLINSFLRDLKKL